MAKSKKSRKSDSTTSNEHIISTRSTFFEKMLEHRFIADMMMIGWYVYKKEIKVLYPERDASGFDLILDCDNIYRYVQLKTSECSSKRSYQKTNMTLLQNTNPCVIWILYNYNNTKNDLELNYFFWGPELGEPLPNTAQFAKKTYKFNVRGKRKLVPSVHTIPKGCFVELEYEELFEKLFGIKNTEIN